jgi:hypothetical protein
MMDVQDCFWQHNHFMQRLSREKRTIPRSCLLSCAEVASFSKSGYLLVAET